MLTDGAFDAVVMHSERRPFHLEAAAEARALDIDVIVTELGYLRPDFMTVERNGNSVDSLFPNDPDVIRALAADAPPVDRTVQFAREQGLETWDELKNSLPNVFLWFLYPHYKPHGLYHPFPVYARFLWRETQAKKWARAAADVRAKVSRPFVFPMQTDTDFQIRSNSQFRDMRHAMRDIFASLRDHAPADVPLVVKKHPADNGPVHWAAVVPQIAREQGVADRVHFVDGLSMADWMRDARGLVTLNSSAGLDGLSAGVPTICLSPAIYDVPGLTDQQPLETFWNAPSPPDPDLFDAFQRVLAASIQVRGTIYNRAGTRAAAAAIAERIASGTVGVPGAEGGPPPRYGKARRLGIR